MSFTHSKTNKTLPNHRVSRSHVKESSGWVIYTKKLTSSAIPPVVILRDSPQTSLKQPALPSSPQLHMSAKSSRSRKSTRPSTRLGATAQPSSSSRISTARRNYAYRQSSSFKATAPVRSSMKSLPDSSRTSRPHSQRALSSRPSVVVEEVGSTTKSGTSSGCVGVIREIPAPSNNTFGRSKSSRTSSRRHRITAMSSGATNNKIVNRPQNVSNRSLSARDIPSNSIRIIESKSGGRPINQVVVVASPPVIMDQQRRSCHCYSVSFDDEC